MVAAGCDLNEPGHICLNKRRTNSVASNVIGAAAYHGHAEVLEYCFKHIDSSIYIDVKAVETADRLATKGGPFKPELHEFTPLQLAMVSPHPNPNVVKILFARDADHNVRQNGTGSNILHLAASYTSDSDVLEYVVKNAKVSIFERNSAGDTPLTICQEKGNAAGVKIIEECQEVNDDTAAKTDELMAELMGEEDKKKRESQRKKEKKHRSKL